MEHDIYDSLRLTATTCEKIADVLNAIAECFEKVTARLMDLIEEIKRQPLKMILQKLRPDYKDKCKIRRLDIPNKVMLGAYQKVLLMGNISRKSKKKLIQKMKVTYHEIQFIKIMYTEEALPRYKVPTKLYCRDDGRDNYPHIAMFFGKKNHPRDVVEVYQHHVNLIK